jgi:hypothetical protein
MLWHDLKRAVHTRHPKNIAELKQFCKEEWSEIPPDRRSDPQIQKTFGLRLMLPIVNPLLNPRVHILFSPCTVNVYMVCSIKT